MTSRFVGLFIIAAAAGLEAGQPLDLLHDDPLAPRAAALGGADAAGPQDLESLVGNPAALPVGGLAVGALGGAWTGQGQVGWGLESGLGGDVRAGLFGGQAFGAGADALDEQMVAVDAAVDPFPGWSVGLRFSGYQWSAPVLGGPFQGGSMDLGGQARSLAVPGIPGWWTLGLRLDNVAGAWPQTPWAQAFPLALRAGARYQPLRSLDFEVDEDWSGALEVPGGSLATVRAGAEWLLPLGLALRGGWHGVGPAGNWSAGVGLTPAGWTLGLDYAYTAGTQTSPGEHQLSLRWTPSWSWRRPAGVEATQLIVDPDSGWVQLARLDVHLDPECQGCDWRVEIKDSQGGLVRTLKPAQPDALFAVWDGKDNTGAAVRLKGGTEVELVEDTAAGSLRRSAVRPLEQAAAQEELAGREAPLAAPGGLAAPVLKGVFSDEKGRQLSRVDIELPRQPGVTQWSLEIQDVQERRLRRMEGEGKLPEQLVWDGLDDQGRRVEDALGVRVKLDVEDAHGRRQAQSQALFTQKALEIARQEARQRPALQLASLGLPLVLGRPPLGVYDAFFAAMDADAEARLDREAAALKEQRLADRKRRYLRSGGKGGWDVDLFDLGGSALLEDRLDLLRGPVQEVEKGGQVLRIWGLTLKGEKDPEGLARRRALACADYFRRFGNRDLRVILASPPPAGDFKGVHLELR